MQMLEPDLGVDKDQSQSACMFFASPKYVVVRQGPSYSKVRFFIVGIWERKSVSFVTATGSNRLSSVMIGPWPEFPVSYVN